MERTADAKSADIDEDEEEVEGGEVSRKDIVQNALRKVRSQLKREKVVTPATVGALEKLLKLDRDILKETEMPHEIRVLWEETDEDPEDDQ